MTDKLFASLELTPRAHDIKVLKTMSGQHREAIRRPRLQDREYELVYAVPAENERYVEKLALMGQAVAQGEPFRIQHKGGYWLAMDQSLTEELSTLPGRYGLTDMILRMILREWRGDAPDESIELPALTEAP